MSEFDPTNSPELHHYTRHEGLAGILGSNTIWATDYRHLNDSEELRVVRSHLESLIRTKLMTYIIERSRQDREFTDLVNRRGGIMRVCEIQSKFILDAFYDTTFKVDEHRAFVSPFIASFCDHTGQPYEETNGLLSQWRAYAEDGFTIVFDAAELVDRFNRFIARHAVSYGCVTRIMYDNDRDVIKATLSPTADIMTTLFIEYLHDNKRDFGPAYHNLVSAAVSLKHQGFKEESEVRFVVSPVSPFFLEAAERDATSVWHGRPTPTIYRQDGRSPHIEIFGGEDLPIKRIIVGPSRVQEANRRFAEAVTDGKIPIACSETPYLGQADRTIQLLGLDGVV